MADESQKPKKKSSDEEASTNLCLFCNGTGKDRDPILLRGVPCPHCKGLGYFSDT